MKKVFNNIGRCIIVLFFSVAIISLSTIITLNSIWIYSIIVDKYKLESITALSKGDLLINYRSLINYLQNPFIKNLQLKDFKISEFAQIHFEEVKYIFIILICILVVSLIGIVYLSVINKNKKTLGSKLQIVKILNKSSNIIFIFLATIIVGYMVNFSWLFTAFHKVIFRNDYWIFNPKIDPIIKALPEELFMICGAIIIFLTMAITIVIKVMYHKKKSY